MVTCKATVRFKAFTPALLRILRAVHAVAAARAQALVITSANDSTHGDGSRHYTDEAIDLRVHNIPTEAARLGIVAALRADLGPAFTVLYESRGTPNAHLHLQPKRGTTYVGPT